MTNRSSTQSINWAEVVWGLLVLYVGARELMLWSDKSPAAWLHNYPQVFDFSILAPWLPVAVIGYGVYIMRDAQAMFGTRDHYQRGVQIACLAVSALCAYSLLQLLLALINSSLNVVDAREAIPFWVVVAIALSIGLAYLASLDFYRESRTIELGGGNDIWDCGVAINFIYARAVASDDAIPLIERQLQAMNGSLKSILDRHSVQDVGAFNRLDEMYNPLTIAARPELNSQELVDFGTQLDGKISDLAESIRQDLESTCHGSAQNLLAGKSLKLGKRCQIQVQMPILKKSALFEKKRQEITAARDKARDRAADNTQTLADEEMRKLSAGFNSPEQAGRVFDQRRQIGDQALQNHDGRRVIEAQKASEFAPSRSFPGQQQNLPSLEDAALPVGSWIEGDSQRLVPDPLPIVSGNSFAPPAAQGSAESSIEPSVFAAQLIKATGRKRPLDDAGLDTEIEKFFKQHNYRMNNLSSPRSSAMEFIDLLRRLSHLQVLTEQEVTALLLRGDVWICQ